MGRASHVAKICMKYKSNRRIYVGTSFIKFDQNQSNHLRETIGVRLTWWRGAMLLPAFRRCTCMLLYLVIAYSRSFMLSKYVILVAA
jgi:hypothetical protein